MLAVVTGANRGIGLEYVKALVKRGDEVIAVCRTPSEALEDLSVRAEAGVDLCDEDHIEALAGRLSGTRIDLLINNAGILTRESLEEMSFSRIQKQFEVNALAPLRVTHALLPNLSDGARVVMMTSRMGSIADNTSGGRYGYRMSKAALNIASVSLAHDLKERNIAVAVLHPGWVRTAMTGHQGLLEPSESVRDLLTQIDNLTLENSGTFLHSNGEVLPW